MDSVLDRAALLLIDDDPGFRALLRGPLERRGFAVIEADDTSSACAALLGFTPDVIIVDDQLADGSGAGCVHALREAGCYAPVLFLSSSWSELLMTGAHATGLGLHAVAKKPVAVEVLAEQALQLGAAVETPVFVPTDVEVAPVVDEALVGAYQDDLEARVAELAAAARSQDPGARTLARRLAHRLRGTSGSYGLAEVGELAARIEELLLGGDAVARDELGQALVELAAAARRPLVAAGANAAAGRARVLIVDRDPTHAAHLAGLATQRGLDPSCCGSVEEAVLEARRQRPELALVTLASGDAPGQAAAALREAPGCGGLPLAFITERTRTPDRVGDAHAGASMHLVKPVLKAAFNGAVAQLVVAAGGQRSRALIVEDDAEHADALRRMLAAGDIHAVTLAEPLRVLDVLGQIEPDLVIIGAMMSGMTGVDVCRLLRSTPRWASLPILVTSNHAGLDLRLAALGAGADDVLARPVVPAELLARVRLRLDRLRLTRSHATRDALTGLLLRTSFVEGVDARLAEARRHRRPLTVAILHVDGLREINAVHGHLAGDEVLARCGRLLATRLRAEDLRGRWSGDELALAFGGQGADTISGVIHRLQNEIAALHFTGPDGKTFRVTACAGLAGLHDDGTSGDELFAVADRRLEAAKRARRVR